MFSIQSAIYTAAMHSLHEWSSELKKSTPGEQELHGVVVQQITTYGRELALILELEKDTCEQRLETIQKRFFYGVVSSLHVLSQVQKSQFQQRCVELLAMHSKKVLGRQTLLILTISAGNGHKTAAYAIEEAFQRKYGYDYFVKVRDVDVDLNTLYESSVKYTPQVYKWLFESTDSGDNVGLVHNVGYPIFARKLDEVVAQEHPDVIVSTYCFPGYGQWIKKSLRARKKYIPLVTVITDSISIHQMWIAEGVDFYIVPNKETELIVEGLGVPLEKIKVFGFPVSPRFFDDCDIVALKKAEGLSPDLPTFLVSIGTGANVKNVHFLGEVIEQLGDQAQCMVLTGKNTDIFHYVTAKYDHPNIKVYGWITDVYKKLQMSDVVVTKAGGATVMECVAIKKPMLITKVLPGQEQGNADLIKKHGLGILLGKGEKIIDVLKSLTHSKGQIAEMKKNFDGVTIKESTYKTAGFIKELLDKVGVV